MRRARDFFNAEEREKINQAVAAAENKTAGEIVPVLATASGRYDRAEDVAGLLLGLAALTVVWLTFQRILPAQGDWGHGQQLTLRLRWVLLVVVVGFIVGAALTSRIGWLRHLLVSRREMREEVERRAWEAFGRFGVGKTAAGTGILLYVSMFERTVCVLGDTPIASKLEQGTWNEIRDTIVTGIRHKRAADAFCEAIARCGTVLAQHFPLQPGDVNELPNELRLVD